MEQTIKFVDLLARNWWAILLKGVIALIFGVALVFMPRLSLVMLVFAFGVYAVADGMFTMLGALQRRRDLEAPRWAYLCMGLVDIAIGMVALFWPRITVLFLLYLIAAKALIDGILQIVAAIRLRRELRHEWVFVLSGIASIAFAALLVAFPAPSAIVLMLWLGIFALIYGVHLVVASLRLHAWERKNAPVEEVPLSGPAPISR